MKAVKSIGLFFAMGLGCIVIGCLIGCILSKKQNESLMQKERDRVEVKNRISDQAFEETLEENNSDLEKKDWASSFVDVSNDYPFLSKDTQLILEEVDIRKGTVVESDEILPEKYVGMNRESFLQSMRDYEATPPLSERQKGFVGLEVLSFSRDRVVVQKNYRRAGPEDGFFLALMDYRVIVLFDDAKTIYMTTDISYEMLPEEMREKLSTMIYVENEQELFDFLEAYTS